MGKAITALLVSMIGGFILLIIFTFVGTLVWWFWPMVIPVVFPSAVKTGFIASNLTWGNAVIFTWLCGLLFKGTNFSLPNDK